MKTLLLAIALLMLPAQSANATLVRGSFTASISQTYTEGVAILPLGVVDGNTVTGGFFYDTAQLTGLYPDPSASAYYYNESLADLSEPCCRLPAGTAGSLSFTIGTLNFSSSQDSNFGVIVWNDSLSGQNYLDGLLVSFTGGSTSFPNSLGEDYGTLSIFADSPSPLNLTMSDLLPTSFGELDASATLFARISAGSHGNNQGQSGQWSFTADLLFDDFQLEAVTVPEPNTLPLFVGGLFVLIARKIVTSTTDLTNKLQNR